MPLASKTSVDYSAGMERRHCGPSRKWPDGGNPKKTCRHFYNKRTPFEVGACRRVEGRITPESWCKLFTPKT